MSGIRCVTIVHLYCIFQKVANNEFTREANISFDSCASDWLTAKYFMWALIAMRIGHVFSCLWLLCAVYGWWLVMARVGCWLMTDTETGPWQSPLPRHPPHTDQDQPRIRTRKCLPVFSNKGPEQGFLWWREIGRKKKDATYWWSKEHHCLGHSILFCRP